MMQGYAVQLDKQKNGLNESDLKSESYQFSMQHGILITHASNDHVTGVYRPDCWPYAILELKRYYCRPFQLECVSQETFLSLLEKKYATTAADALQESELVSDKINLQDLAESLMPTEDILDDLSASPGIKLINALLQQAVNQSASDVHFEPFADKLIVRLRIDGVLHNILEVPANLESLLVSRIKIIANLDIAEKRLPQDGRFSIMMLKRAIDIRVSTIPVIHGERVVLRLLNKAIAPLALTDLGMNDQILSAVRRLIAKPHGIILVTGPTGCGKTTTLYAMMAELLSPDRNLMTVEDPVEYDLPGIAQIQINQKAGVTFPNALRSILRQDPDIIMVGEIRDVETANMAIQASLTGQLILSTLHTNSAASAIIRLKEIGTESFYISSSLIGVVAQRLVRLLCDHCKKPRNPTDEECRFLGIKPAENITIYFAGSCEHCHQSGYSHRIAIFELIEVDDAFRDMIYNSQPLFQLEAYIRNQFLSIVQDGARRVLSGDTSIAEIIRVATE